MRTRITDQDKIDIVQKYLSGEYTCTKLAEEYGRTIGAIGQLLKRRGVLVSRRKYSLDESYFDFIDTEDKAYFLGLLYADGCNSSNRPLITISLQEEDLEILEKFKNHIQTDMPCRYISNLNKKDGYIRKPQWCLAVFSKNISDRLTELGCTPNKSLTLKFPTEDQVPKHLLRHFLRGMWDGDGSYSFWKSTCIDKKYNKIYYRTSFDVSLVGTDDICIGIRKFIEESVDIRCSIREIKNKEVKRLKIIGGMENMYKFMTWLYKDSNIHMNRKYKKCKEIEFLMSNRFDTINFFNGKT